MYKTNARRCDDCIVSITQPYIRPVIRGKQGKTAEFGAKISVSLTGEGLAHVDELHWNAQHEGHDLKDQVEACQQRYGYYPEVVIAAHYMVHVPITAFWSAITFVLQANH